MIELALNRGNNDQPVLINIIYFLITAFLFSSMEIVSKPLMKVYDPIYLTFLRFLFGLLILLPFYMIKKKKLKNRLSVNNHLYFLLLGGLNVVLSMSLLQISVKFTTASSASMIFCSNPFFVAVFALFILNYKISKREVVGIAIGLVGIFILLMFNTQKGFSFIGGVFALMSAISFALYIVLSKKLLNNISIIQISIFSFLYGTILFVPALFILKTELIFPVHYFINIIYLGFIITGFGYICFFKTIKVIGASSSAMIFFLKPVISFILAFVFLREEVSIHIVLAIVFLLSGAATNLLSKKREQTLKEEIIHE